ncbi:MAG TPA: methyltransferase domain-containing protein [Acidimicrobiales bacterium]|nr:methyltransferase domain-containing protein [Acidimicrobiales bacterium]
MSGYTLRLNEHELNRYRMMATHARAAEQPSWQAAGIGPGARIVDVGCGPGLPLLQLAEAVGPEGRVVGVDQSEEARETAAALAADHPHVEIRAGDAAATGLPEGEWDIVHMRHVLLHNGPRIGEILRHAADLLRSGGHVYLNETWADTHITEYDIEPDVADMDERYWRFIESMGNDLAVGPHLGRYAGDAGFEVVHRQARFDAFPLSTDVRPPSWAGRQAMLAAGVCTEDDIARWDKALTERVPRGVVYVSQFTIVGAKP